jgi:hypothetical protein
MVLSGSGSTHEKNPYELKETGQGLNRMQQAPRTKRALEEILHAVKAKCSWVGDSTIHLCDSRDPFWGFYRFVSPSNDPTMISYPFLGIYMRISEVLGALAVAWDHHIAPEKVYLVALATRNC